MRLGSPRTKATSSAPRGRTRPALPPGTCAFCAPAAQTACLAVPVPAPRRDSRHKPAVRPHPLPGPRLSLPQAAFCLRRCLAPATRFSGRRCRARSQTPGAEVTAKLWTASVLCNGLTSSLVHAAAAPFPSKAPSPLGSCKVHLSSGSPQARLLLSLLKRGWASGLGPRFCSLPLASRTLPGNCPSPHADGSSASQSRPISEFPTRPCTCPGARSLLRQPLQMKTLGLGLIFKWPPNALTFKSRFLTWLKMFCRK